MELIPRKLYLDDLFDEVMAPSNNTMKCDIYEKDGKTVSVPFHGSKEMGSGIARRFIREMGLK